MLQSLENIQEFAPYPRVWYNPAQMEYYAGRHYCFRNKDIKKTNISNQSESTSRVIHGIELGHNHSLRSEYHLESRSIYQTWASEFRNITISIEMIPENYLRFVKSAVTVYKNQ